MDLKSFEKDVGLLVKEYDKLRSDFDRSKGPAEFNKFQEGIRVLRDKHEKLQKQTDDPMKGVLREANYYVEQMEKQVGKISRGINSTGEIEYHLTALRSLFEKFEEAKKDLKRLDDDLGDMEADIKEEQGKFKRASIDVKSIVNSAMRKVKLNKTSST
jgi:hypothetical protein